MPELDMGLMKTAVSRMVFWSYVVYFAGSAEVIFVKFLVLFHGLGLPHVVFHDS